jgi:hypothetical protein
MKVLAIASGVAVAAKDQMHSLAASLQVRHRLRSIAQVPQSAQLHGSLSSQRFAATALCLLTGYVQPVSGAAATRKALPAFTVGSGGGVVKACSNSSRWRCCGRAVFPWPLGHQLCSQRAVLPNPSLEPTRTGMALGPRGARSYHPPRGPSAIPALAAQLKR